MSERGICVLYTVSCHVAYIFVIIIREKIKGQIFFKICFYSLSFISVFLTKTVLSGIDHELTNN